MNRALTTLISPMQNLELEELTLLRVIMGKARTIAMLCDKDNLDLASARLEATSLVKKIGDSRALIQYRHLRQVAEQDAFDFCVSVQGLLAGQSGKDWYLDFLNAHDKTAMVISDA